MSYKEAINKLSDEEIILALNAYHKCILDLSNPEWRETVLKYVRDDYRLEVNEETGNVTVMGAEHPSYFGEFILFDYTPKKM